MKNLCFYILAGCLLAAAAGGCQSKKARQGKFSESQMADFELVRRRDLPVPSGGLVLSINQETVTADEVVSPLMSNLEPMAAGGNFQRFSLQARGLIAQAVMNKTADVLLYQQARKQASNINEDALDKAAQSEVNKFVANYRGNVAEANKAVKEMGMGWQEFHDYQKRLLLTQYYISQKLGQGDFITHSELLDKYNKMKEEHFSQTGEIRFRLIDISTDKIEQAEALNLARKLIQRIRGGEDFGELAKEYSNDAPHRASQGGLWAPVTPGSLAAPHDSLEQAARNMNIGDVSGPIETNGHIFIMKLESKKESGLVPFESVQARIEAEVQFQRRKAALDAIIEKLMRQANIVDMDIFVKFCIETAYRRCVKLQ
ncbi:MAG: peptidylprolyl isomerase [Planctomycetota bacterium]|jgi:parvulin-like peptidyl-prolyl isomerase